ncbi:flagellar basal body P-ring formation chaperone FlgA [Rhizobium paknamense]|uniref:Flagella basal body P-ring formation protein FlgA n=1 Tax=Rhizobium paknamense TaxID=1206817 RepID=A0ABU0IFJ3_9HYPH|nr:flagellar basal body P-ring formation chaperone FlgA [Rhizobium paknamense]MDQ0456987.1 flagella basal body P-ring formation protein FlgA [Rhizobium paknamense]
MMFRRMMGMGLCGAAVAAMLGLGMPDAAIAKDRLAVVPTDTIYPGEVIAPSKLDTVKVTNPNLVGGYAADPSQVIGMLSTKTLLAGRTIPLAALKKPYAVTRGDRLRLVFNIGSLTISATGSPMDDANIGDVIRVRNLDSGQIVTGTVMADGTVQVMAK